VSNDKSRRAERLARQIEADVRRLHQEVSVWARPQPPRRQPRYTREEIAATALRIADAEGIDAVSMRRVAAELGAGTMTLYHYVSTKDDLLALVSDAVIGENLVPAEELPDDWREALSAIARRTRAACRRHPWIFGIVDDPSIGPNGVRHVEQCLEVASRAGIDFVSQLDVVTAVDEYVFGFCLREREGLRYTAAPPEDFEQGLSYVFDMINPTEHRYLSSFIATHGRGELVAQFRAHLLDDDRFERNLARLLDGIERDLHHRRADHK
jgi:AcrR family transcriptional regulator